MFDHITVIYEIYHIIILIFLRPQVPTGSDCSFYRDMLHQSLKLMKFYSSKPTLILSLSTCTDRSDSPFYRSIFQHSLKLIGEGLYKI